MADSGEFCAGCGQETLRLAAELPRTPDGSLLRVNVLMFGDDHLYFVDDIRRSQMARYEQFVNNLISSGDPFVVLELGDGKRFPEVRVESERLSGFPNGTLIRINTKDPEVTNAGPGAKVSIAKDALMALKEISQELQNLSLTKVRQLET